MIRQEIACVLRCVAFGAFVTPSGALEPAVAGPLKWSRCQQALDREKPVKPAFDQGAGAKKRITTARAQETEFARIFPLMARRSVPIGCALG